MPGALELPAGIRAGFFDLNGVLTPADIHVTAWRDAMNEFLRQWEKVEGIEFESFDERTDYALYIDGRRREDGIREFLKSRHITLPETAVGESAVFSVQGLSHTKEAMVRRLTAVNGVMSYQTSVRYIRGLLAVGIRCAVVSSSTTCDVVLQATGIGSLFDYVLDGVTARREGLASKPEPDMYLAAAMALSVSPAESAVFEDAIAGVRAGRCGGFGWVVGIDRRGQAEQLRAAGADVVVRDLGELTLPA